MEGVGEDPVVTVEEDDDEDREDGRGRELDNRPNLQRWHISILPISMCATLQLWNSLFVSSL